jgi:hypothetical protein
LAHRLVAEAFIRKIEDGEEVRHIDCDPANNKPDNLEIVTHKTNQRRVERRAFGANSGIYTMHARRWAIAKLPERWRARRPNWLDCANELEAIINGSMDRELLE